MNFNLTEESIRWTEAGIIDETQRERILNLYKAVESSGQIGKPMQESRTYNPMLITFAIIGSLLLSLGVVLIFASNWDNITRNAKLVISFLPLLAAIGMTTFSMLKRSDSAAFKEGTSIGLSLSVFATIALVGQVFQTTSYLTEFLALCMTLMLPALYLFNAKSPAALYVICAIWVGAGGVVPLWFSLMSVAAIVPYFVLHIKKKNEKGSLWYLTLLIDVLIIFTVVKLPNYEVFILKLLIAPVAVMAFEAFIKRVKGEEYSAPLTPLSLFVIIGLLIVSSFRALSMHETVFYGDIAPVYLIAYIAVLGGYAVIRFKSRVFSPNAKDIIVMCAALGLPMFWLWSNALLLALGIWLIRTGSKSYSFKYVNSGMLVLIGVIISRFFDLDLGLMARGIVFMLIGAAFIFINFMLHRKWRKS